MGIATREKSFIWFNILKWLTLITSLSAIVNNTSNFKSISAEFGIRANEIPLYYESLILVWLILFLSIGFLNAANRHDISCIKIWVSILIANLIYIIYASIYLLSSNMIDQAYIYDTSMNLLALSAWFIPNYIYLKRREHCFRGFDPTKKVKSSNQFSNKPLADLIIKTSENLISGYEYSIRNDWEPPSSISDKTYEDKLFNSRKKYLDDVRDSVFNYYKCTDINVYNRLCQVFNDPSLCGLGDVDMSLGHLAGILYAMCYWAVSAQVPYSHECITLNHFQNDIINSVFDRIASELSDAPIQNETQSIASAQNNSPNQLKFYRNACTALGVCLVLGFLFTTSEMGRLKTEIVDLQTQVVEKDKEIDEHSKTISNNKKLLLDYEDIMAYAGERAVFLDENIVLTTETGNKYHKYGCQYTNNVDGFYIFEINEAKYRGYTACSVCY